LKLLLDEMLSPAIARALRARGHDVEAIKAHPDWEGLSDPDIVALARREQRAIVTTNLRDFRPLHVELITPGSAGHSGFVFVPTTYRLTRTEVGRMVAALEAKLTDYPGERDLANGETWI
jgi:predicted nuclease of predicted toxin-antitoxin system